MFTSQYHDIVKGLIDTVFETEEEKIRQAGRCIADTVEADGLVHIFGCGHSHMLGEELFYRAGGLVPIDPLFEESAMLHAGASKSSRIERMSGYASLVIGRYTIKPGDTFLVSSSSGINSFPIEMAEEARKRGAVVVAITSSSYFADPSRDREGRHLCDLCDICIDNHVPHGDAVIPVDGEVKAGPVSSIVGFYIVNSMMLAACEELDRRGIKPPVFKSGNVSGGDRYNAEMVENYLPRVRHL